MSDDVKMVGTEYEITIKRCDEIKVFKSVYIDKEDRKSPDQMYENSCALERQEKVVYSQTLDAKDVDLCKVIKAINKIA